MVEDQFETERKFLVTDPSIIVGHEGSRLRQIYLYRIGEHEARIRLERRRTGPGAYEDLSPVFTLKGPQVGATRPEPEMRLSDEYGKALYEAAEDTHPGIEKMRYSIVLGVPWEIDVFEGSNIGLIIAEYEAKDAAMLRPSLYPFLGREVTRDRRYRNSYLSDHPWSLWPENQP